MDRIEAMTILVAVTDAGSFSAAARKLNVSVATVSRKIVELEARLNTRLIIRSTRKLMLTDTGVNYVAACKSILEQVNEAESAASGEYVTPCGHLTLTAPMVFGQLHLLPIINDFLATFRDISVRLKLTGRTLDLLDDRVDIALRIGQLPDSNMIATQVGMVRRVVCASPAYLARCGRPQRPTELTDFACVNFESLPSGPLWTFLPRDGKPANTVAIRPRLSINAAEGAIDAAIAGVGLTHVLSYQIAQAVEQQKLQLVLRDYEPEPIPVSIVRPAQGPLPMKVRHFIDFAVPRLRKALAGDKVNRPGISRHS